MAGEDKKVQTYVIQLGPSGAGVWPDTFMIHADERRNVEGTLEFKLKGELVCQTMMPAAWWILPDPALLIDTV